MKKIVIVAWFFPPNNHTAAQRARAWASYFWKFNLYPVIITRNWDTENSDSLKVNYHEHYEVHYTPYKPSFKENFLSSRIGNFKPIRYVYLALSLLFEHVFIGLSSFKTIREYSLKYIKENTDAQLLLITGAPFHLFKIGYDANKKYGINYVCDYRDGWNVDEATYIKPLWLDTVKKSVDKYFEKKWLKNILFFTTVSEHIRIELSNNLRKSGYVIYNGYFEEDFTEIIQERSVDNELKFIYSGTLFSKSQSLDFLSNALRLLVKDYINEDIKLKPSIIFLGTACDQRSVGLISEAFIGLEEYIKITDRLPKLQASQILATADAFLMICHKNAKGIVSSKIFEYLLLKRPILISPTDSGIVEEICTKAGLGILGDSVENTYIGMKKVYNLTIREEDLPVNWSYVELFSRLKQSEFLALKINQYLS